MQHKLKMDAPLSESSVSHKLSEIQKRCSELLEAPDGLTELHLVDADGGYDLADAYDIQTDPYNSQRLRR